jgi:putative flippase GtrA
LLLASRFIAAGLVNTAVGAGVILGLDVGLGLRPAIANAIGYAIGICIAWVMHRGFVFRATETGWKVKAKYLTTVMLAFCLNQLVLAGVGLLAGGTPEARVIAQMLAIVTYSAVQFVLMRLWVFEGGGLRQQ